MNDHDDIRVHHVHRSGLIVEGIFHPSSGRLDIVSGPVDRGSFNSPSRAASAVVKSLSPGTSASRNGWIFWRIIEQDEPLRSLRHQLDDD
jgi:hypothetical protein